MATILMTWELGGGLGHLMQLQPLAQDLAERGHRVVLALRDLSKAGAVFGGGERLTFLQAPFKVSSPSSPILPSLNFAHILHNIGFEKPQELETLTAAWRNLFRLVRPEVIVCDHSPTALLAARGLSASTCVIGSGFLIPPDQSPLPNLCPWLNADPDQLLRDERRILGTINALLESWGQDPLARITQLYSDADESFLLTFRELDHYPDRRDAEYWGTWNNTTGGRPEWSAARADGGKKIYAYLKPFPQLLDVLRVLKELGHPTLAFVPGAEAKLREHFNSPASMIRIEERPLDLHAVAGECDLAILNGNYASTVHMLLAGKPTLQLPFFLEQSIFAKVIARLGAGLEADQAKIHEVAGRLQQLLTQDRFGEVAGRFAEKYRGFDPRTQLDRMLDRIERLLAAGR